MVSQDRLKELFCYDPETGVFTRLKKTTNSTAIGEVAGNLNPTSGYLRIMIDLRSYQSHILAWLYVHGNIPQADIDHINHKRSDNRISNLRKVSRSENLKNSSLRGDNKSGIPGVSWIKRKGRWLVYINSYGKRHNLGSYKDKFSACCARKSADIQHEFHPNHGKLPQQ